MKIFFVPRYPSAFVFRKILRHLLSKSTPSELQRYLADVISERS